MENKESGILKDKIVAVVSATREPIMVSSSESQLLEELSKNPEVVTMSVDEYIASLPEGSATEALDKIDTLMMVDGLDGIHHELLMESINKKKSIKDAKDAELVTLWKEQEKIRNQKGYKTTRDGNVILINKKVGRNELCVCGSGKKHKKCCGA